jgi:nitrogen PTS system EIIA component
MDLKMKDIIELFEVPEEVVFQWIKDKKMPAYKIRNQYLFNKAEINEWTISNNIAVTERILDLSLTNKPVSIIELLDRGGIYYGIDGQDVTEVINNVVNTINLPKSSDKKTILVSLLQREEMMTTAVGKGIAFPHPRNPIISDMGDEGLSICFLKNKVDYGALDGEPVSVLFVIISSNAKRHLEILSKISFLCKREEFIKILKDQPQKEIIRYFIGQQEKEWDKR